MNLKNLVLDEAEASYVITKDLFNLVSNDDLHWFPPAGNNWMTVGQLLMHCANFGCGKAVQGFTKGDWGLPEGLTMEDLVAENQIPPTDALPSITSVEEAIALLEEDRKLTLCCISEIDETTLLDKPFAAPWGGREFPLFLHLLHMIEHLNHHKAQLFYYLKLMGKNVNGKDLWGV